MLPRSNRPCVCAWWQHNAVRLQIVFAAGLLLLSATGAQAQDPPLKGVVWAPPSDIADILSDLTAMRDMRMNAVQTGLIQDERILTIADSFGLELFQEIPISNLSASSLLDTLAYAQRILQDAVRRSRPHRSARHFGLAGASDTSDPEACTFFETLTSVIQGLPGAKTYYRSAFIDDDQCSRAVDFVLLDARVPEDPAHILRRWTHAAPAGLGAVGRYVTADATGLLHPHSAESQARYLETHLNALLSSESIVIFVYRWRDAPRSERLHNNYGLISGAGTKRLSYSVVRGIYGGTQRAFAFPRGTPQRAAFPWHMVLGWLAFGVLGLLYYSGPRFRHALRRYFTSHSFYVESIRDGRGVLRSSTATLIVVQALCIGVLLGTTVEWVQHHAAFRHAVGLFSEDLAQKTTNVLSKQWLLIGSLATMYAALMLCIPLLLKLIYFWNHRLSVVKTYMIVVWPNWRVVPLAFVAMTIPALPTHLALNTVLVLFCVWLLAAGTATIRVMIDLALLDPRHSLRTIAYFCGTLILLVAGIASTAISLYPDLPNSLEFFWHLATRT